MTINTAQITNMNARQLITAGIAILLFIIVAWLVVGMFRHGKDAVPPVAAVSAERNKISMTGGNAQSQQDLSNVAQNNNPLSSTNGAPVPTSLDMTPNSSREQAAFSALQHEIQEKYVAALNELQMLRLTQQIATTNKEIAAAKLDTIIAEKKIVDLLAKPAPVPEASANYSNELSRQQSVSQSEANSYIVLSVSELMHKWRAVIGSKGKLYSVFIGDILPPDQSTVVAIDKYGVLLENHGIQHRISLVPVANG